MLLEKEDKSLVTLDEREARFKAMLQYLILREACDFESNVNDTDEKKAQYENLSAKKILKEMELKFYDLFVKDDLVEDYLFFGTPDKVGAFNQKDRFKNLIQQKISDKITVINSADTGEVRKPNKELLKKIVRSPIIENSIMTCDLVIDPSDNAPSALDNTENSNLISNIDNVFQSRDLANIKDNSLVKIRDIFLSEADNECCKIEENSIAIHAHLKTATSLSLGFLELTGKLITKALGIPSESVSEGKILRIVNSLSYTKDIV